MSVIEIERSTTRTSPVIERLPVPPQPARPQPAPPQVGPRSLRPHAPKPNYLPSYPSVAPISQHVVRRRQVCLTDGFRNLLWKCAFLTGVFVCGYVGTALSGQVMVESARRQEINAEARAVSAQRAEATLRKHVYALMDREEINRWASTHGFVAPESMVPATPTAEETGAGAQSQDLSEPQPKHTGGRQ